MMWRQTQQSTWILLLRSRGLWRSFSMGWQRHRKRSSPETGVCAHNKSLSIKSACACDAAKVVYNGFLGPIQEEPK